MSRIINNQPSEVVKPASLETVQGNKGLNQKELKKGSDAVKSAFSNLGYYAGLLLTDSRIEKPVVPANGKFSNITDLGLSRITQYLAG